MTVEVVVISVPTAVQRRKNIATVMESLDCESSFFDAHTSLANPRLRYSEKEVIHHYGRTMARQEMAVYSSHYTAWEDFISRDQADFALILEDDVIIDPDFPLAQFAAFCEEKEIDYMRLFGKHYAKAVRLGFFFDRSIIRYKTSTTGAQAYLISRKGADCFLRRIPRVRTNIDISMDRFWETGMPLYALFPYPVIERYSPTSIPIPNSGPALSRWDRLAWNINRSIDKARKIRENWLLAPSDARMRRSLPRFHQIV